LSNQRKWGEYYGKQYRYLYLSYLLIKNIIEVEWKLFKFKSLYLSLRRLEKEEFKELFFKFLEDRNEKRIKIS